MKFSIRDIARMINADILQERSTVVTGVAGFVDAGPTDLTFAADARFLKKINTCRAGAVIVASGSDIPGLENYAGSVLVSDNPKIGFFKIVSEFFPKKELLPGVSPAAAVGRNVFLGDQVYIGAHCFIGNNVTLGDKVIIYPNSYIGDDVTVGEETVIKPNVTVMDKTVIGKQVIIHSGTVIGSDGFGFVQQGGCHEKLEHAGYVEIGDRVEIGACNTIDRGTLGRTLIEDGVKTDNLVHIAHNVRIGKNTLIVAQVGIAGSASIGSHVILAGRAGVSGHLSIGDHTIVGPGTGVMSDVPPGQVVSGFPHMPHKKWLRIANFFPRLLDFRQKILSLEKRVRKIETTVNLENR